MGQTIVSIAPKPSNDDDLPTLRLSTLRRLLARSPPLDVFDQTTPLSEIERALCSSCASIAILVDSMNILRGTVSHAELERIDDHAAPAEAVMSRRVVSMLPETDIEAAYVTMMVHRTDHVLVVTASGELLGALSKADLERAQRRPRRVS